MRALFFTALLALSAAAFAQPGKKVPAAAAGAEEQPALDTGAAKPAAAAGEVGTTIIGDTESPIGLYITPWRESNAEKDIDRPARLLQEEMLPIDKDVFERQIEYYDALSGAAKRKGATP
jgi:hypothetical protein